MGTTLKMIKFFLQERKLPERKEAIVETGDHLKGPETQSGGYKIQTMSFLCVQGNAQKPYFMRSSTTQ